MARQSRRPDMSDLNPRREGAEPSCVSLLNTTYRAGRLALRSLPCSAKGPARTSKIFCAGSSRSWRRANSPWLIGKSDTPFKVLFGDQLGSLICRERTRLYGAMDSSVLSGVAHCFSGEEQGVFHRLAKFRTRIQAIHRS